MSIEELDKNFLNEQKIRTENVKPTVFLMSPLGFTDMPILTISI